MRRLKIHLDLYPEREIFLMIVGCLYYRYQKNHQVHKIYGISKMCQPHIGHLLQYL